jgi:hypothetical protein
MRVSQHIIDEAKEIVLRQSELPQPISSAPLFLVALGTDDSVLAFSAFELDGSVYKIGPARVAGPA